MTSRDVFAAVGRTRAILAILLGGAALRLYALGRESFWIDELYSISDALGNTTIELLTELPVVKNHTPAYYVFLRQWERLTGITEVGLRLPAVLAGVGTIYVVYLVGTRLFDPRRGAIAAGLVALSRYHIAHSQEVRMYAFVGLLTGISFYWLVELNETYTRRSLAGYLLTTALLVYTHPYGVFVILGQNVYVWARLAVSADLAHDVRRWLSVQTGLGVLLVPYGVIVVRKLAATVGGGSVPLDWRTPPDLATIIGTPIGHAGYPVIPVTYEGVPVHLVSLAIGIPIVYGVLGVAVLRRTGASGDAIIRGLGFRRENREGVYLCAAWLAVPILAPAVVSHLLTPIYGLRYTIGASLALFLLLAHGVTRIERRHLRYGVAGLLVLFLVVPVPVHYAIPTNEQWRESIDYVTENAEDDDLVVFPNADTTNAWEIYAPNATLTVREVDSEERWQELNGTLREHETIWVLNRTFAQSVEHRPAQVVLNDTHRMTDEKSYYGVDVYRFDRRANVTNVSSVIHPDVIWLSRAVTNPGYHEPNALIWCRGA
ncbi:MAG: glycosyltransferase family 39 protein [Halobacteriales archaeon]